MPKKRTKASLAPRRGGLTCTEFDIASEAVPNDRATGATVLPDVQFGREPARSKNIESFKTPLSEEL